MKNFSGRNSPLLANVFHLIVMSNKERKAIKPGLEVDIVLKQDQRSGKTTHGIVKDILTTSSFHPHGIKVRLESGAVGRVKEIFSEDAK